MRWDVCFYRREVVETVIDVILVSLQDFGILVCVAFGIKIQQLNSLFSTNFHL